MSKRVRLCWLVLFAVGVANAATAQDPHSEGAASLTKVTANEPLTPQEILKPGVNEHPLAPALRWAKTGLKQAQRYRDYSCLLVKRERVHGRVTDHQYVRLKVRHEPFSVYACFITPEAGQEAIYVAGQNDGRLWAHPAGRRKSQLVGTISLRPNSARAMQGNRHPITHTGVLNLAQRLIEHAENDMRYGECEVKYFPGAKVNDRECTCVQVTHPRPRREFAYHLAKIFVDDQLNLPIRFESYTWPEQDGGQPPLLEEYTFLNLKTNNGFTDRDFDVRNPDYGFPQK